MKTDIIVFKDGLFAYSGSERRSRNEKKQQAYINQEKYGPTSFTETVIKHGSVTQKAAEELLTQFRHRYPGFGFFVIICPATGQPCIHGCTTESCRVAKQTAAGTNKPL